MGRKESNRTNKTGNPLTGTSANGEDPNEMPHDAAFHQGLLCLLRENQSSGTEVHFVVKSQTCDLDIYNKPSLAQGLHILEKYLNLEGFLEKS